MVLEGMVMVPKTHTYYSENPLVCTPKWCDQTMLAKTTFVRKRTENVVGSLTEAFPTAYQTYFISLYNKA